MILVNLCSASTSSATLALGSIPIITTARRPIALINMLNTAPRPQLVNHKVRTATLRLAVGAVHADIARRTLAPVVVTGTLLHAKVFGCSAGYGTFAEDFGEGIAGFVGLTGLDCVAGFKGLAQGSVLWLGEGDGEEGSKNEDG
jgi:hypothetical protein